MARPSRLDEPGSWHHVVNRGIARRTVFETREDSRYFISRLAYAVRRGELEVHAFCVLTTHFHLLLRSPSGTMSAGMRRAQNEYVRYFNRRRRRDGPLFRGRYISKPVETLTYRHLLVRYIDANSVKAGLARAPHEFPYASARSYLRASGPPWLERSWIEGVVSARHGTAGYDPRGYVPAFGGDLPPGVAELVESRLEARHRGPDPLDDLLRAAPEKLRSWLQYKARLADGTRPGMAICDARSILEAIERKRAELGDWALLAGRKRVDGWTQVLVGLLRDLAGLTAPTIVRHVSCSSSWVGQIHRRHREMLVADEDYAERVGELALEAWRLAGLADAV